MKTKLHNRIKVQNAQNVLKYLFKIKGLAQKAQLFLISGT